MNIDYHISVEGHLYSVPYRLVGATVAVRLTATMLEVLHQGTRVAAHARSVVKGRYTTEPTHRPKSHQQHLDWSPSRLVAWGASIGEATARVVEAILARQPHPEQGYRAVKSILATGLDQLPLEEKPPALHLPADHAHVRGAAYYQACATDDDADVLTLVGEPTC